MYLTKNAQNYRYNQFAPSTFHNTVETNKHVSTVPLIYVLAPSITTHNNDLNLANWKELGVQAYWIKEKKKNKRRDDLQAN